MVSLQWPIHNIGKTPGVLISQRFGENINPSYRKSGYKGHMGLDIACPTGTPVYAAHDGNILFAEDPQGYGHHVYNVSPDAKYQTVYGHLSRYEGQPRDVKAGDLIGYAGSTGNSTGPHIHFGLMPIPTDFKNGYAGCIDPFPSLTQSLMPQFKTQNYKGELRIVLQADDLVTWDALCKVYGKHPDQFDEVVDK